MGMVMATVKVAQALPSSIFTTAKPIAEMAMVTVKKMPSVATPAATGPSSRRAISASERPSRRTLADMMTKSWTAPPRVTPIKIHNSPGRKPNCAASTGPMSGPAPVMAAKWCPNSTQRLVGM